jgi:hypothetical protein
LAVEPAEEDTDAGSSGKARRAEEGDGRARRRKYSKRSVCLCPSGALFASVIAEKEEKHVCHVRKGEKGDEKPNPLGDGTPFLQRNLVQRKASWRDRFRSPSRRVK